MLAYFLQNTTDIHTLNNALFSAAIGNQTNNIALLLKHGADINTKDEFGAALLIKAAMYSEPETLQFLIDHGAKANDPTNTGSSALMMAAEENQADNIRVLLRAGADLMYVSSKGRRTVFTYATAPEAKAVVLEALGQHLLRTGE